MLENACNKKGGNATDGDAKVDTACTVSGLSSSITHHEASQCRAVESLMDADVAYWHSSTK